LGVAARVVEGFSIAAILVFVVMPAGAGEDVEMSRRLLSNIVTSGANGPNTPKAVVARLDRATQ
jgi:glutamate dehydrogenase/leucine dehydrogenase